MKASEALTQALAMLGPHGENWVNHMPTTYDEHCIVTPFATLGGCCYYFRNSPKGYLRAAIDQVFGEKHQFISDWNDASQRTFPEVKAAFERAIELAKQEEIAHA